MSHERTEELVCLEGSPIAVGRAFGQANASDIRAEVEAFLCSGPPRDAILRAADHYRSLVEQYAPHWLDEAAALAQAAGVRPEEYVAYQGAKYRGVNRADCFTYFSAARHNAGRGTLFHKNRDNVHRPQAAYVKGLEVSGRSIFRYAATGDTSDMGTMMGLNERGLAAAADVGAPDPKPRFRGMMNPDVMRVILEQAAGVDQAHDMLKKLHADRAYAGGNVATNWMFADATGRALRVYQCHESLHADPDRDGLHVMREADERGKLVLSTLAGAKGSATPALMNRLSRTPPVLCDGNVSAMTAVIPASQVDLFGYAHFAVSNAGRTVYVPLYLGAGATPRGLLDGSLYRVSTARADGFGLAAEEFESRLDAERSSIEAAARAALGDAGRDAARQALAEGCAKLAAHSAEYLARPEEA